VSGGSRARVQTSSASRLSSTLGSIGSNLAASIKGNIERDETGQARERPQPPGTKPVLFAALLPEPPSKFNNMDMGTLAETIHRFEKQVCLGLMLVRGGPGISLVGACGSSMLPAAHLRWGQQPGIHCGVSRCHSSS
jgi:hypothetical protein